jgi:hypothetical protein
MARNNIEKNTMKYFCRIDTKAALQIRGVRDLKTRNLQKNWMLMGIVSDIVAKLSQRTKEETFTFYTLHRTGNNSGLYIPDNWLVLLSTRSRKVIDVQLREMNVRLCLCRP